MILGIVLASVILIIIVFRFIRLRKKRRAKCDLPPEDLMRKYAAEAVSAARDECNVELDFSIESVEQVESILGGIYDYFTAQRHHRGLRGYAFAYGAYIGEVLKKHLGEGHWERDHPVAGELSWPFIWNDGRSTIFPLVWCGKRLTNGSEDNIWFKFKSVLDSRTPTPAENPATESQDSSFMIP